MSLGERIYKLRTEKNLSQGDLAEMLDVSRQSISKWENNSAVPDLEKIVKLSDIFGISLDELVKGELQLGGKSQGENHGAWQAESATGSGATANTAPGTQSGSAQPQFSNFTPRIVAGIILLCMAFLVLLLLALAGGGLASIIFASPFLLCGIICLVFKKNVGLWCGWAVYFCIDMYLRYATGINWSTIRLSHMWTYEMNYARLGVAWVQFLVMVLLIALTAIRFWKQPLPMNQKSRNKVLISWGVFVIIYAATALYMHARAYEVVASIFAHMMSIGAAISYVYNILDWCRIVTFTVALVYTVRYIRGRKKNKIEG